MFAQEITTNIRVLFDFANKKMVWNDDTQGTP
jgi:hypothetical protein